MFLQSLNEVVVDALGFDPGRIRSIARKLREAEILPQGGRGLSAAHVEPEHAFDLVLGYILSDTLELARVRVREFYSSLRPIDTENTPIGCENARKTFGALIRKQLKEGWIATDNEVLRSMTKRVELPTGKYVFDILIEYPLNSVEFLFYSNALGSKLEKTIHFVHDTENHEIRNVRYQYRFQLKQGAFLKIAEAFSAEERYR